MKTIEGYDVKIFTDNIDNTALEQLKQLMSIDVFSDKKIRIMPDVHAGTGCVIGFTGDLGDKVIPNIVGVDIGCGMRVVKLGKLKDIDFHGFHRHINLNVPSGLNTREEVEDLEPLVEETLDIYNEAKNLLTSLRCYPYLKKIERIEKSVGTLGGGNHFIELDRDDNGDVYLVIHTGSRNLGKQIANFYQAKAVIHMTPGADDFENELKRVIEEYKAAGRQHEIQTAIERMRSEKENAKPELPEHLCYLEGEERENYLHDMRLCQKWATLNRKLIATLLLKFFPTVNILDSFETVHNYISDNNIIRKGSISAEKDERCIIPLNMRDGSLICIGKGNPDWNNSAPHGAGRILSRTQANEKISMADFKESMQGIYSESVNESTIDESPMAYKPADEIIANIGDTVNIEAIIRPIFNFKASY